MSDREDVVLHRGRRDRGREPSIQAGPSDIDFDVLRGWSEQRDPGLRTSHRLPALAELIQIDDRDEPLARYPIHGPDILVGRYRARHGPVDLGFPHLRDHEAYRLAAPHARLECDGDRWRIDVVSPRAETRIDGQSREHLHDPVVLENGAILQLGVTRFRFRTTDVSVPAWREVRDTLLDGVDEPALFLKRHGGVCGPCRRLDDQARLVVGRTHPEPGVLPDTEDWPEPADRSWDLSGLFDHERKYVGFRHLVVDLDQGDWRVRPISSRQRTFVNRIATSNATELESGDEIGLGSVLLRFHHPHRSVERSRPSHVPSVVDWSEGRPPTESLAESTEAEES